MAALPAQARRPVAFGYAFFIEPQRQPLTTRPEDSLELSRLDQHDSRQVARVERFVLDQNRLAASANTTGPLMLMGTCTDEQMASYRGGASSNGSSGLFTVSGISLTGARSSFSIKGSARSSRESECSSLAPYWVPDEIKHYFRHRHSELHCNESSSQKNDAALQEIGNERELSGDDESGWIGKCCRDRRHVLLTTIAVAVALLICLLLGELLLHFHGASSGSEAEASPAVRSSGEGPAAKSPIGAADDNRREFPMPAPRDKRRQGVPEVGADTSPVSEPHAVTASGTREMVTKHDTARILIGGFGSFWTKSIAVLRESGKPTCGKPVFKDCTGGPPEFYYNHTSHTCMELVRELPGLCNRGPNRFTSMESCRHECEYGNAPAAECSQETAFTECQARDVVDSWWWYLEGRGCRRWRFPRGRCPSEKADVFRTSLECIRRCVDDREKGHRPCHGAAGRPVRSPAAAIWFLRRVGHERLWKAGAAAKYLQPATTTGVCSALLATTGFPQWGLAGRPACALLNKSRLFA
ncbi:hypothetical protein HPB50_013072 [Hyalomma asiaticum]|uniref:Uncharacterized protein n=1 Tax=Hyalomma asiaticum TaxID=266040 RepID=A0ACB7TJ71_HYAAI|nr:hypothetical protein HPB50_013072 [Hyalomma asiaticum]